MDGQRLDAVFQKYRINTSNFVYYNDQDIIDRYPQVAHWNLTGETRGAWLQQQAIKLAAIDMIDAEQLLIHDPDSFCIKPYEPFVNGELNLFYLPNTRHANGYYEAFTNATGFARQTEHCFVCDMMPVRKQDWVGLKSFLQNKFSAHWLDTLIDCTPWDYVQNLKWFSEYEFLGNWHLANNKYYQLTQQHRYEIKNIEQLTHHTWPAECNFVSEKNPQGYLLRFNYADDTVAYFDEIYSRLASHFNTV